MDLDWNELACRLSVQLDSDKLFTPLVRMRADSKCSDFVESQSLGEWAAGSIQNAAACSALKVCLDRWSTHWGYAFDKCGKDEAKIAFLGSLLIVADRLAVTPFFYDAKFNRAPMLTRIGDLSIAVNATVGGATGDFILVSHVKEKFGATVVVGLDGTQPLNSDPLEQLCPSVIPIRHVRFSLADLKDGGAVVCAIKALKEAFREEPARHEACSRYLCPPGPL